MSRLSLVQNVHPTNDTQMAGNINISATSINDNYASKPTQLSSRLAVVNVTLLGVFLQQIAVAERLLIHGTLIMLGAGVYDHESTQVARARKTFAAHLAPIPMQATMEVFVQLQTAVRHKRLVALRATPRLPLFTGQRLRKRSTNCRSTCPVGCVGLQVDNSGVISSVYLHACHLCDTLHSK